MKPKNPHLDINTKLMSNLRAAAMQKHYKHHTTLELTLAEVICICSAQLKVDIWSKQLGMRTDVYNQLLHMTLS